MIDKLIKVLRSPTLIILEMSRRGLLSFVSDEKITKLIYWTRFKEELDLKNPKRFNEKLSWLKLYDHSDLKTELTDKLTVREYVANSIGDKYLIPLLGKWTNFEDIDFSTLPDKFVLKCNHDSQSVKIVDKRKLTKHSIKKMKKFFNKKMKYNYYQKNREKNYRDISPYIIAEKYISDPNGELKDYKFFVFDGEVQLIQVDSNRFSKHTRAIYTPTWEKTDYRIKLPITDKFDIQPEKLDEMIAIVNKLSKKFIHVRVDLYYTVDRIYFGEMTFHHGGCQEELSPKEFDLLMGSWIKIPIDSR